MSSFPISPGREKLRRGARLYQGAKFYAGKLILFLLIYYAHSRYKCDAFMFMDHASDTSLLVNLLSSKEKLWRWQGLLGGKPQGVLPCKGLTGTCGLKGYFVLNRVYISPLFVLNRVSLHGPMSNRI